MDEDKERARLNKILKEVKQGTLRVTEENKEELTYLVLDAAWARLKAWPFLFLIAGPGNREWEGWQAALKIFLERRRPPEAEEKQEPTWVKVLRESNKNRP